MEKPEHHIFVCMSFRGLEPKGKCIKAIESGGGKNKLEIGEDLCE